ncbi:methylthioribose transporter-like [Patiria miniata]|uniref:Cationic amino acid transporter C-terminal domain-containing protein n=1 Tax=Patiria miniata TaxID=46514 RepID=A0A914AB59_PATMI|nr:methylthioribose transporter-like [Patiria miniata]
MIMAIARSCRQVCGLFTRRKHAGKESNSTPLKRCLTAADLTFVGIGAMLGSGVYILPGEIAGEMAGPAAVLSFLIAGSVALLNGFCFLECAGQVPQTGAAYVYAYASLGELVAFLVGWNAIAIRVLALVFLARGWSAYFDDVLGGHIRNFTIEFVLQGEEWDAPLLTSFPDFTAGVVLLLGSIPVVFDVDMYAIVNNIVLALNLAVVSLLFIVSMFCADFSLLTKHGFFPLGYAGVMKGAVAAFIGFCGFDAIALSSEEAKNPSRGLPIGLINAFGASFSAYTAGTLSLTVLTDYQVIQPQAPFASAFGMIGIDWLRYIISLGAISSMTGGILTNSYCLSRFVYPMSRDGLLPALFAKTNERTKTPIWATMFGTSLAAIFSVIMDFVSVINIIALLCLMEFTVVCSAVVILRYSPCTQSGYVPLDSGDEDTGDGSILEMAELKPPDQTVNELNALSNSESNESITGANRMHDCLANSPSDSSQSSILHLIKRHPRTAVVFSLASHFLFEVVLVALLTYMLKELQHLEGAFIYGVIVSGSLSLMMCYPLLVLPTYDAGLSFKVPLMPLLPLVALLCDVILIIQLDALVFGEGLIWMSLGLLLYLVYGVRHSLASTRFEDSTPNDN